MANSDNSLVVRNEMSNSGLSLQSTHLIRAAGLKSYKRRMLGSLHWLSYRLLIQRHSSEILVLASGALEMYGTVLLIPPEDTRRCIQEEWEGGRRGTKENKRWNGRNISTTQLISSLVIPFLKRFIIMINVFSKIATIHLLSKIPPSWTERASTTFTIIAYLLSTKQSPKSSSESGFSLKWV